MPGERAAPPHRRTFKHLAAPWTSGTSKLSLGMSEIDPGSSSSYHRHGEMEEIFYVLSGTGEIRVEDERAAIDPGSVVCVPAGLCHQLINTGETFLRVLWCCSPPYGADRYEVDRHRPPT